MATYHCSIKNGKTGNAKRHCEYILREGSYANGPKKEELVYKQFGNLPDWSAKPTDFFAAADLYERKNGNAYKEFEIALPAELSLEENIKLVQCFVEKMLAVIKRIALQSTKKMQHLIMIKDNLMRTLCSVNA